MSLENWHKNGWLMAYQTSTSQIAELFAIAERDLADARTERLSADWQFGIAYNADYLHDFSKGKSEREENLA